MKSKENQILYPWRRESGESDEQTLIREIAEELSVTIIPNTAEYIGTFSAQSDGEKKE
jgi:8-oxo-dGTP pyrophosphatase MutT (NUDIX family)